MSDIVRRIDTEGDWTWGKGRGNYIINIAAVSQNIQTRILMFFNDCFFANTSGIDWWNLLGSKQEVQLVLAISSTIINTNSVTGIQQLSLNVTDRVLNISYAVQTVYGATGQQEFQFDLGT